MNKYNDKNWLYEQYWEKGLSIPEMAEICGVYKTTVNTWMNNFNIPKRSKSECQELWKVNNGRTLCETCHMKTGTHGQGTKQLLNELNARKD